MILLTMLKKYYKLTDKISNCTFNVCLTPKLLFNQL
jgi:hypothetical protein